MPGEGVRCGLGFVYRWSALNERRRAFPERLAAGGEPSGELLRPFADGMDRGNQDVQRPLVVNGYLRWGRSDVCVGRQRHRRPHGHVSRDRHIESLLDQAGLGAREADARPHELSGGQRQRLAIAGALAVDPQILVLGEAVAALEVSICRPLLDASPARIPAGPGGPGRGSRDPACILHIGST